MNCRNCRYSEKKKMRMTICFKRTAAAVLLLVVSGCSAPAASQHEDTYVCREIDSYNYNEPLPETAESSDLDAFIGGDTRIGSLDLYGTLEEKNTDVYFGESMNIFQVNSVNADGQDETLYDLLMKTEKKNIYLLLGLNEIGYENYDSVADQFQWLINEVKNAHPDAHLCFILNYTPSVYYGLTTEETIERTGALNAVIKDLAVQNDCFFLDLSPALLSEEKTLKNEYTYDGIHLNPDGVSAMENYILTHALNGGEYVKEVCE